MKSRSSLFSLSALLVGSVVLMPACDSGEGDGTASVTAGTDTTTTVGTTTASTSDTAGTTTTGNPVDCSGVEGTSVSHIVINSAADSAELDGIANVNGDLWINNTDLTSLGALVCAKTVSGSLSIFGNQDATGSDGLDSLESVTGSFTFSDNPGITVFEGANGVTAVDNLTFSGNTGLTTISGLSSLNTTEGHVLIQINDSLESIAGLKALKNVGGSFKVTQNPNLCVSQVNSIGSSLDSLGDPDNSSTASNKDC